MAQIENILNYNSAKLEDYRRKWGYYLAETKYVPIMTRPAVSPLKEKTETRVHSDFFNDIIDLKIGYLFSKLGINSDDTNVQAIIDQVELTNNMSSMNIESGRYSAVDGISYRLAYNDFGTLRFKNIPAWQIVSDYEEDVYDSERVFYFHNVETIEGSCTKACDIYDETTVSYYVYDPNADSKKGAWVPNLIAQDGSNVDLHMFNQVPIFPFPNNGLLKGNCDNVLDMMDTYDNVESDIVSEIRASRLAYLKIWGELNTNLQGPDGQVIPIPVSDWLTKFGTMVFGMDDAGNKFGDASFLEKKMDDAAIEHQLDRLRQQIYEQSHSIDIKQLTDAASARVFTVKAALMRFEIDASTTESFLRRSLLKQLSLISEYEMISGRTPFNPQDVQIFIGRSFPVDIDSSATALQKMLQVLPVEKAYALSDLIEANEVADLAAKFQAEQDTSMLNTGV